MAVLLHSEGEQAQLGGGDRCSERGRDRHSNLREGHRRVQARRIDSAESTTGPWLALPSHYCAGDVAGERGGSPQALRPWSTGDFPADFFDLAVEFSRSARDPGDGGAADRSRCVHDRVPRVIQGLSELRIEAERLIDLSGDKVLVFSGTGARQADRCAHRVRSRRPVDIPRRRGRAYFGYWKTAPPPSKPPGCGSSRRGRRIRRGKRKDFSMATYVINHEVGGVEPGCFPQREEVFGPMGVTVRLFRTQWIEQLLAYRRDPRHGTVQGIHEGREAAAAWSRRSPFGDRLVLNKGQYQRGALKAAGLSE